MNRLLGPVGYYYGSKPDRALKKEKLLRQLRQRFPHLAVYPHPSYWKPWLNPKSSPESYAQHPYFAPGLNFPFVLLKGHALREARHIRFPYGVFQLRPWRFQPPLFNARLTKRMRRGRFHNVFHKKSRNDNRTDQKRLSSTQVARAMEPRRRNAADIARLRARLWADAQGYTKVREAQKYKREKVDIDAVLKDDKINPKERNSARSKSTANRNNKSKSGKTTPTKTKTPSRPPRDQTGKSEGASQKRADKGRTTPTSPDDDSAGNANIPPQKTEREALEAIARRKKQERHVQREAERIARERRKAEDDYLKKMLNKALKPGHDSGGMRLKPSRSQRQRALYRKYQDKEKLTEEEQLEISEMKAKKLAKKARKAQDGQPRSEGQSKQFPYGNMPPKFQRTPATDDRFFWSSEGPELRNHTNRTKPNVFRRQSDDMILDADDAAPASTGTNPRPKGAAKSGRSQSVISNTSRTASKKASKNDVKPRPSTLGKLAAQPKGKTGGSKSSSPAKNSARSISKAGAKRESTFKPDANTKIERRTLSTETLEPGVHGRQRSSETGSPSRSKRSKRRIKKKLKCAPKTPSDPILKELQAQEPKTPPTTKIPESFIEQREELMRQREIAWKKVLREKAKQQKERREKIKADRLEREKAVKEIIKPTIAAPKIRVHQNSSAINTQFQPKKSDVRFSRISSHQTLQELAAKSLPPPQETKPVEEVKVNKFFPAARNRRQAFRAYIAKQLLRVKAQLVFKHRLSHHNRFPKTDRWGRPAKNPEIPAFDPKNPYLVKVIRNLIKSKTGFRYKYESRVEEFLANFPFVEYTTYRKFPTEKMSTKDRKRYYERVRKMYRGMQLFKMMTPVRWYAKTKKNLLENPFDNMVYSDAVEEFKRLAKKRASDEKHGEPGEQYQQFGMYEVICAHLKVAPFKPFLSQMENVKAGLTSRIDLAGRDLTDPQVRPIALCLMLSQFVECLDISGNLVGLAGTRYIAGICGTTENLNQLNASNNQFGPDGTEILFRCLRRPHCKMRKLELRNCSLGPESSRFIAGIIMHNRSLVHLDLSDNHLANIGNNDMFGLAIAENNKLEFLDFSSNGFNERASHQIFIGAKSNSSLRTILFSFNHIGEKGAEAVNQMLQNTELLHTLFLERCFIQKSGAVRISKGITANNSLINLRLRDNPLGPDGSNVILKVAVTKENLKNVDLSLCSVNTAFVGNAKKATDDKQMFVDHTGDKAIRPLLPVYPIDVEALALKKAKDNSKKKNKDKKK